MAKLGWISDLPDIKDHADELVLGLIGRAGERQLLTNAMYRKNENRRINAKTDPYALQAWCWQVLATPNENLPEKRYETDSVDPEFLSEVARLSSHENGPLLARELKTELNLIPRRCGLSILPQS